MTRCVHVLPTGSTPQVRCEDAITGKCSDGSCFHYQAHRTYTGACDKTCERVEEVNWKRVATFNSVLAGGGK